MASRQTRPPAPPPGLWDRPEMGHALANRDIGTAIRIYRRWTGASQTDVGIMVGLPQPHVSDIERGVRKVSTIDLFDRIADGLGIPRTLLGLASLDDSDMATGTVAEGQREWLKVRKFLAAHRADLTKLTHRIYPESLRLGDTGILMRPEWRLPEPIDLSRVNLRWQEKTPRPAVNGGEREARRVRPPAASGRDYSRYHRAMRDLARPRLFENRLCYRLLDAGPVGRAGSSRPELRLTLGEMCYFDMIDVGEGLAHETALAAYGENGRPHAERIVWKNLPFRRMVSDPFDLASYPLLLSISTLTVRRGTGTAKSESVRVGDFVLVSGVDLTERARLR